MEDDLDFFFKRKTTSMFLKMEDDLNFCEIEDDLNFKVKVRRPEFFDKLEEDLDVFLNGRWTVSNYVKQV